MIYYNGDIVELLNNSYSYDRNKGYIMNLKGNLGIVTRAVDNINILYVDWFNNTKHSIHLFDEIQLKFRYNTNEAKVLSI